MKKTLLYFSVIILFVSCGKKDTDPQQAELDKLKKERSVLDGKIKKLEEEIAKKDTTRKDEGELVTISDIIKQPFTHYIEVQGRIDADENVLVTPQMPGVIDAVYVSVGQSVSKGQVLAEMDHDAMQKNIETLESQMSFAKDVYEKQKALWDQKIGSEVQYLSAKNNMESLQKSIDAAREQLSMSRMVSPISGVVDAVDIKAGQIGSPGFQGIRVVNLSSLKAKGEVSETHASVVSEGDNAKVFVTDLNKEIETKLTFASRVINTQSRTFSIEAKLNSDPALKPNMIAVIKIADYATEEAVVIDLNMIQHSSDADFVYVASTENGKNIAQRRTVVTGQSYNGKVEVISGLQPGDKIISAGYADLIAGEAIRFN